MENLTLPGTMPTPVAGTASLNDQIPGQATTVDGVGGGNIAPGQLMETDIDKDLFEFESDDTPIMQVMLASKKVPVQSPVVEHYMLDEKRTVTATISAVTANTGNTQFVLPVTATDKKLCQVCGTLRCRGINGYAANGATVTPNVDLMLYVVGRDTNTGNPIVAAVNGPKNNATDEECTQPAIPSGTVIDILGNAMHETQLSVDPDSAKPIPELLYLQKRGMSRIISDYFESQRKRIPFANALLAEHDIREFKRAGNRTLWAGVQGVKSVMDSQTGPQKVYFTKGLLYQFKRVMEHSGSEKWTYEQFISAAKMFYTGADVPSGCLALCGKNFLENIQCIDFSKHPEVKITVDVNQKLGWKVTTIHTVFGDFQFKWEPTLDKLGFENSAALIGEGRTVHYQRTAEHTEKERINGHEADRTSMIVWDALALKGSCHIFINGESDKPIGSEDALNYTLWDKATAPTNPENGQIFLLTVDCPGINAAAVKDEFWKATVSGGTTTWAKYTA